MTEKKVDDTLAKLEAEAKAELAKTKPTKKTKTIKSEKGENMKNFKTIAKYVATVVVTLGVVYAGWSLYQSGYNQGRTDEKTVRAEIKAEVAKLSKQ